MKQIPTPETFPPPPPPPFAINWAKPVIEFDPWPFAEDKIKLDEGSWYISRRGSASQRTRPYVLTRSEYVLGTATDGNPFVTSSDGLQAWMAR